jgi:hypothetical protein
MRAEETPCSIAGDGGPVTLALADRIGRTLPPFTAEPITRDFGLSSVTLGDLFSSFV